MANAESGCEHLLEPMACLAHLASHGQAIHYVAQHPLVARQCKPPTILSIKVATHHTTTQAEPMARMPLPMHNRGSHLTLFRRYRVITQLQ